MKEFKKFISLLLAAILLLSLAGCVSEETPSSSSSWDGVNDEDAVELYANACAGIYSANDLMLHYTVDRRRAVNGQTFTEKVNGDMTVKNVHLEDMTAVVTEQLLYGSLETTYKEIFCDGKSYIQVNDSKFAINAGAEAYLARQYPVILINADFYEGVYTEQDQSGNTVIHFVEPIITESWLRRDSRVQMQTAAGRAVIDPSGRLLETGYSIVYVCGNVTYTEVITMQITIPKELDITGLHPEHFDDCPTLENADALKLLLRSVGDVYSATNIHCQVEQVIDSAAVPVRYTQRSSYSLGGAGGQFSAKADHRVSVTDYRGVPVTSTQLDLFENGVFSSAVNDGAAQIDPDVTAEMMRNYIEDVVLSAAFNPNHIASVQLEVRDTHYYLRFQGNEAFVQDLMAMLGQYLQMDLDEVSQSSDTIEAGGYLKVDRHTGLPIAMGLKLTRKHTLNSVSYDLLYQLDQELSLLNG